MIDVHVEYRRGRVEIEALRGANLSVAAGEFLAINGPSGSGKSTLLRAVAGLCVISEGEVKLDGRSLRGMTESELAVMRRRDIGMVHQLFNLLPDLSASENVGFPLDLDGFKSDEVRSRAIAEMERLGIAGLADRMPEELSGGEQLRVALARALVVQPLILLADEPTGALDQEASQKVMSILRELNGQGITILMVTHNPDVAAYAERTVSVVDGAIID